MIGTNETSPLKEIELIEELFGIDLKTDTIKPKRSPKNKERKNISSALKKHYGFKLPNYCDLVIIDNDKTCKEMKLLVDNTKLGRVAMRKMVNSPYFKYISFHKTDNEFDAGFVYFVFGMKAAFKREYNALFWECEFQ